MSDIADSIARKAGIGPQGATESADTTTPNDQQKPAVVDVALEGINLGETSVEESLEYASGLLERTTWELEQEKVKNERLRQRLLESKRKHYYCGDSFYSCPKTLDEYGNVDPDTQCSCGADDWNAKVDAELADGE